MKITFYGAAKTVTGSCHMVEACGKKFLVDCGLFQGSLTDQMLNYEDFPFNVNDIDFVVLTHAHIDHAGRIPKLYKAGFDKTVYATNATVDLCDIMLPDSGHIQEKEIEWVNKKRKRAGKTPTEPIYTAQDAIDSLSLFHGVDYNEKVVIDDNISLNKRISHVSSVDLFFGFHGCFVMFKFKFHEIFCPAIISRGSKIKSA